LETFVIATERLTQLTAFREAPVDVVTTLAAIASEVRYATGQVLFLEGSAPRGWYIVLEGRVRVVRGSDDRQHVIHTEVAGGTLAEVPLFADGPHPATAIAAEPTVCALLPRDALHRAIQYNPAVSFLLLRSLALRVRRLVDRLDQRSAQPVQARLAEYLLALRSSPRDGTISLGMTQHALAEELGTVREVVARELAALCRDGCIGARGGGRYMVLDREALRRTAEG
jgi:CRP-like cAMP-binding protein